MSSTAKAKAVAIYVRVSSRQQTHASQLPDLESWAARQDVAVTWYRDTFTGKTMSRKDFDRMMIAARCGQIDTIVIWRLDRLGRTAQGLTALIEELRGLKVNLVSLRDGLDLETPAGRLMANVLASVAQYETEVRGERIKAGIDAAHAAGKTWGGSTRGTRIKVTNEQVTMIHELKTRGTNVSAIARTTGLSRPTIYSVLA